MNKSRSNLELTIGWIVLLILVVACFVVLRPFLSAFLWAIILSFSSWPIYRRVLGWVGNRRSVAAFLLTLGLILIVLVPILIVGATLVDNVKELTVAIRRWLAEGPPAPPDWLAKVPVVGPSAVEQWQHLMTDTTKLWQEARRLVEPVSAWLLKVAVALGGGLLQFALSIFIAFFLLRDGVLVAERSTSVIERIGGERGKHLLALAGNTIRGVVYGILGTAFLQGVMAGIGFLMAGVPGAGLLALMTFFLSILPILGPAIVWLPAAIWLFHQGSTGWGIFMLIWGLGVNSLEHVAKPIIISHGSHMPFLLVFFGVLGGALAFGFIGVFLGPTLLAVGYRLLREWASGQYAGPKGGENSGQVMPKEGQ